ncbi:MAG: class II aldolase/adducin family protein [Calditrichaeota bacterium]|nr:class II aldolase/adducin family protein [Calditrichota bacterium]
MNSNIGEYKDQLLLVGKRMYDRGYVASNDGNISARLDEDRFLITPTGMSKGFMKKEDLIVIDRKGRVIEGNRKPSSEVFLHLAVYEQRPDVRSVCHAHPPYATAFAVAGIPLDECVLPEVIITLGHIPLVEYGTTGTDEICKPLLKYVKEFDAFLLANHGVLTVGGDLLSAYHKMETVEHFARILTIARQLGNVNVLPREEVNKLIAARHRYGIKTKANCRACDDQD